MSLSFKIGCRTSLPMFNIIFRAGFGGGRLLFLPPFSFSDFRRRSDCSPRVFLCRELFLARYPG